MLRFIPGALAVILLIVNISGCEDVAGGDFRAATFDRLERIRTEKKLEVISSLERMLRKAADARSDPALLKAFNEFRRRPAMGRTERTVLTEAVDSLDQHYVMEYGDFYDILFVDRSGLIFHSIKMESDFGENLFNGFLAGTKLSRALRENPDIPFVDYDFYGPSGEAASFFITRLDEGEEGIGWFIFQFSINTINAALADYEGLGITGEVYLTNQERMMITQSRLVPENTVLNLKVDTPAPQEALEHQRGNMLLDDYRGVRVFSSFEKFSFNGAVWIIVAEIDEAEVVTEHFQNNKERYWKLIVSRLDAGRDIAENSGLLENYTKRVDINEYGRGDEKDVIATFGVAPCTSIIIDIPGKFAYLGHIYPLDESYHSFFDNVLLKIGLRLRNYPSTDVGDLLGEIIGKLKYYDIRPSELKNVRVTLAAVHTVGFPIMVDKLLDAGFFLSQIQILYSPGMRYLNIADRVSDGSISLHWIDTVGNVSPKAGHGEGGDLGTLVKSLAGVPS